LKQLLFSKRLVKKKIRVLKVGIFGRYFLKSKVFFIKKRQKSGKNVKQQESKKFRFGNFGRYFYEKTDKKAKMWYNGSVRLEELIFSKAFW